MNPLSTSQSWSLLRPLDVGTFYGWSPSIVVAQRIAFGVVGCRTRLAAFFAINAMKRLITFWSLARSLANFGGLLLQLLVILSVCHSMSLLFILGCATVAKEWQRSIGGSTPLQLWWCGRFGRKETIGSSTKKVGHGLKLLGLWRAKRIFGGWPEPQCRPRQSLCRVIGRRIHWEIRILFSSYSPPVSCLLRFDF
mgnify:CR=1 FL=1